MQIYFIHEAACVGCARCLTVCPVDAIIGTEDAAHTVITHQCIGCKRCIPVCPMDCILLKEESGEILDTHWITQRVKNHKIRLTAKSLNPIQKNIPLKQAIADAVARVKAKLT